MIPNLILYRGDGISIKDKLNKDPYDEFIGYYESIFYLARLLGCKDVLDGNPGRSWKFTTENAMTRVLQNYPEYTFGNATVKDIQESITLLLDTNLDSNHSIVQRILMSSKQVIYLHLKGNLLDFILDNPSDSLSKYFMSRLSLILGNSHSDFPSILISEVVDDYWRIDLNESCATPLHEFIKSIKFYDKSIPLIYYYYSGNLQIPKDYISEFRRNFKKYHIDIDKRSLKECSALCKNYYNETKTNSYSKCSSR